MRLWSIHPRYLDRQGLTGGWREALLAQAVLADRTRGYRAHPQLVRFRTCPDPVAAIGAFLLILAEEATERGYRFDRSRIDRPCRPASAPAADIADHSGSVVTRIPVTDGQVAHEWQHLLAKLGNRAPQLLADVSAVGIPDVHPLFEVVPGPIEPWERPGHDRG